MAKYTGTLDIKIKIDESMRESLDARIQAGQKYIDWQVIRLSEKYLPYDEGILQKSGRDSIIGSGLVTYNTPYARNMYYGKVMVDPITGAAGFMTEDGWRSRKGVNKVVSDRDYVYQEGPMRGAFWFERMKADHKDQILKGAAEIMRKGGSET